MGGVGGREVCVWGGGVSASLIQCVFAPPLFPSPSSFLSNTPLPPPPHTHTNRCTQKQHKKMNRIKKTHEIEYRRRTKAKERRMQEKSTSVRQTPLLSPPQEHSDFTQLPSTPLSPSSKKKKEKLRMYKKKVHNKKKETFNKRQEKHMRCGFFFTPSYVVCACLPTYPVSLSLSFSLSLPLSSSSPPLTLPSLASPSHSSLGRTCSSRPHPAPFGKRYPLSRTSPVSGPSWGSSVDAGGMTPLPHCRRQRNPTRHTGVYIYRYLIFLYIRAQ